MILYIGKYSPTNQYCLEVIRKINEGKAIDMTYIYFSKAFDNVLHGSLVQKVRAHGVQGVLAY